MEFLKNDKELNTCSECTNAADTVFYYPDNFKGQVCMTCLMAHLSKNLPPVVVQFIHDYEAEFFEILKDYYLVVKGV